MWREGDALRIDDRRPDGKEAAPSFGNLENPNPEQPPADTAEQQDEGPVFAAPLAQPNRDLSAEEMAESSEPMQAPQQQAGQEAGQLQQALEDMVQFSPDAGQVTVGDQTFNISENMSPEEMMALQQQMQQQMGQQMQQQMGEMGEMGPAMIMAMIGGAIIPVLVIGLAFYALITFVFYRIGKKFGVGKYWEWLIPIYNMVLLNRCAGTPMYVVFPFIGAMALTLLMIPMFFVSFELALGLSSIAQILNLLSIISLFIIIGKVAERLGKSFILWGFLGVLGGLLLGIPYLILAFDSSRPVDGGGGGGGGSGKPSWSEDDNLFGQGEPLLAAAPPTAPQPPKAPQPPQAPPQASPQTPSREPSAPPWTKEGFDHDEGIPGPAGLSLEDLDDAPPPRPTASQQKPPAPQKKSAAPRQPAMKPPQQAPKQAKPAAAQQKKRSQQDDDSIGGPPPLLEM